MPREFSIPEFYRSDFIHVIKASRALRDPKKKDRSPSILDFGPVRIKIARHFGFCFGVENAIEIAYKVLEENPGKKVYLLSEVIHNPLVNNDLISRGIKFLMKTDGTRLIDFNTLTKEDIVVVPAFGTTVELQNELESLGISPYRYDATCPFVEKVWKRAEHLGNQGFSVIVHGKSTHEETRATFSHSMQTAPTLIVLDMADSKVAISYMKGEISLEKFNSYFKNAMSNNFDASVHLQKIGVVNQTTMLASDTKSISETFKQAMVDIYGEKDISKHFADTRDTLCYATYENQTATKALTESGADLALVVGGYNSSNTSHLVELCEESFPTYYIKDSKEILSNAQIRHFDLHTKEVLVSKNWLPDTGRQLNIAIAAGASCPDKEVDLVITRVLDFFPDKTSFEQVINEYVNPPN